MGPTPTKRGRTSKRKTSATPTGQSSSSPEVGAAVTLTATTTAIATPLVCPSCSSALELVGRINRTGENILLCHNEKKAFRGSPSIEFVASATRHPDLYRAITEKDEPTLNIEDVVLTS